MLSLSTTRIIVVGDENTGKTALISVLIGLSFPKQHIPTIQDEFETDLIPSTVFVDTPGSSAFDRMRPFSFEGGTDVILVFAKDSPNSFTELEEKWIPEVKYYLGRIPTCVVMTKCDLPGQPNPKGRLLCEKYGYDYFEVSCLDPSTLLQLRSYILQKREIPQDRKSLSSSSDGESVDVMKKESIQSFKQSLPKQSTEQLKQPTVTQPIGTHVKKLVEPVRKESLLQPVEKKLPTVTEHERFEYEQSDSQMTLTPSRSNESLKEPTMQDLDLKMQELQMDLESTLKRTDILNRLPRNRHKTTMSFDIRPEPKHVRSESMSAFSDVQPNPPPPVDKPVQLPAAKKGWKNWFSKKDKRSSLPSRQQTMQPYSQPSSAQTFSQPSLTLERPKKRNSLFSKIFK